MPHQEFKLKTAAGAELYGQAWTVKTDPKGVICLVHGLGEHCGRYAHVGEFLNNHGYSLVTFDNYGHGKSPGKRGHVNSNEDLVEGVDLILAKGRELVPDVPVYLYGHSWGGNIVSNYLIRKNPELAGVVLSGAWLKLPQSPPAIKVFLAKIMNNIFPSFQENNGLDPKDLTHDTSVVEAYENDPLVHPKISARNFLISSANAENTLANAGKSKHKLLIMHGSADKMTSPEGSKLFAKKAGGDVTLKIWEGMYHEIHNELKKGLVLDALKGWLDS